MTEVEIEIEHHFEKRDEVPANERIDPEVRIVKVKETGEFFIENGIEKDKGKVVVNAGGLTIKIDKINFDTAYLDYVHNEISRNREKKKLI